MSYFLVRHKVSDYDAWKPVFDEHGATRQANGSKGGRLFRSAADPNEVVILFEWEDLDRARWFAESDDLRETMERAGVVDKPDLWFIDEADQAPV